MWLKQCSASTVACKYVSVANELWCRSRALYACPCPFNARRSVSKAAAIVVIFHSLTYLVGHVLQAVSVTSLLLSRVQLGVNFTLRTPARAAVVYMTESTVIFIGMYRLSFSEGRWKSDA